ncbi:aldose 1-epimerase family protein [Arcticibacterium luteifluviistationis]|uniref:Aldose epimerase n=1 Tax=Arcticibacterium luteifluviistationis TaxID=1784714 RepID=A0A2Z4GA40_9BACT|nr:aldose 1-epimerase family protein [Arcticibacterium luteifluviistationis]AWV98081.1 aldose epimerase [Arcticibacterium luteifluviistationis]
MISLENESLKVWVKPKGAELKSLVNKKTGIEHIWDSDPDFWAKSSPVLFPIVGGLKDDTYIFEGKSYTLPRHGFARDNMFELVSRDKEQATFKFESSEATLKVYPFHFDFFITYVLDGASLAVNYKVVNTGDIKMLFSLGAHPAFAVPFDQEEGYNNFSLEFDTQEDLKRWPLSPEGLIEKEPIDLKLEDNKLDLTKELFEEDALVFKNLKSEGITLKSKMSQNYLKFTFSNFPFFGIWAAKNSNFVCLEPWCGIADSVDHNQELTEKEGMNTLAAGQSFERGWAVEVG